MKKCYKCKQHKTYSEFHRNRSKQDGFSTECKSCRKPANKPSTIACLNCGVEVNVKQTGKIPKFCSTTCKSSYHGSSRKRVDWLNNNIDRRILYRCKDRAKKLGLPFNLTLEDCVVPEKCPILGISLEYSIGRGYKPNTPSIDRIIPERGYVKGNVRIISWKANVIKNDATLEEIRLVYEDYKRILEEITYDV